MHTAGRTTSQPIILPLRRALSTTIWTNTYDLGFACSSTSASRTCGRGESRYFGSPAEARRKRRSRGPERRLESEHAGRVPVSVDPGVCLDLTDDHRTSDVWQQCSLNIRLSRLSRRSPLLSMKRLQSSTYLLRVRSACIIVFLIEQRK